jgi:nucleoside-diphosphate-sugar epimerase
VTKAILVTGGVGYLGSLVVRQLHQQGYRVIVLDNGLTTSCLPLLQEREGIAIIHDDIRSQERLLSILGDVESVIHLAALVGDASCALDPHLAWEVNYHGTISLVEACRLSGINRFVFASTCSVYGRQENALVHEWSPLSPQSIYAQTKILAEQYLLSMRDDHFSPMILRFSTLYGLSPRMRFDLAINHMTAKAVRDGQITVYGGEQVRPFLHVHDAAWAILLALKHQTHSSEPPIYNCGTSTENYTLKAIGQLIAQEVPQASFSVQPHQVDHRSYQVDFTHITEQFPFACEYRVQDGIREIITAINQGQYHDYSHPRYSNEHMLLQALQQSKISSPVSHYDQITAPDAVK